MDADNTLWDKWHRTFEMLAAPPREVFPAYHDLSKMTPPEIARAHEIVRQMEKTPA